MKKIAESIMAIPTPNAVMLEKSAFIGLVVLLLNMISTIVVFGNTMNVMGITLIVSLICTLYVAYIVILKQLKKIDNSL